MSEQIEAFVDSVGRFIERRLPVNARRELLERGGWDPALLRELDELGWSLVARPEERDGLGLPLSSLYGLFALIGHNLVPGPLAEQIVLPALLDTPADAVLAFADPGVTCDWSQDIGGLVIDQGRLNGTVELVRFGAQASHLVCLATDSASSSATLVLLRADASGVEIRDRPSADPLAHYARVTIADHVLTGDAILLRGTPATARLVEIRAWLRIFTACEMAGIARRVLDDTVGYVGQRKQFGRAVGSFQGLKHLLAGMAQATISLESYCQAVLGDSASGDAHGLELDAWSLKAYAAEAARKVCEDGLQAHGGIGFTVEYDLHWYLRRCLALRSWYGDEREMNRLAGRRRLDDARGKAA